jgi:hypothetical protein
VRDVLDVMLDDLAGAMGDPDKVDPATLAMAHDLLEDRRVPSPILPAYKPTNWTKAIVILGRAGRETCPTCNKSVRLPLPCLLCEGRRHVLTDLSVGQKKRQIIRAVFMQTRADHEEFKIGVAIGEGLVLLPVATVEYPDSRIMFETWRTTLEVLHNIGAGPGNTQTGSFLINADGQLVDSSPRREDVPLNGQVVFGYVLERAGWPW